MNLPTKYRPITFKEVVGQDVAVESLQGMLKKHGLPPLLLISGPHSTGKTTLARIIAMGAVCADPQSNGEGCGECQSCKGQIRAMRGGKAHADIAEINAASERGIDMIRSLKREARFAPTRGRYRIFILDEAHAITRDAFQAGLKLFEEPPARTRFIMCTTNPEKVDGTIRSRAQHTTLRHVDLDECWKLLKRVCKAEGFHKKGIKKKMLREIAASVQGHPRDALNLLEQVMNYRVANKDADLKKVLPQILENSEAYAPYKAVAMYLTALFNGQFELSLMASQHMGNPEFFIQRVLESLQQILYSWVNPNTLNDQSKAWFLNDVEVPDGLKNDAMIEDLAAVIDLFVTVQERHKSYLVDTSAMLDATTIRALAITRKWRNDDAAAGSKKPRKRRKGD